MWDLKLTILFIFKKGVVLLSVSCGPFWIDKFIYPLMHTGPERGPMLNADLSVVGLAYLLNLSVKSSALLNLNRSVKIFKLLKSNLLVKIVELWKLTKNLVKINLNVIKIFNVYVNYTSS
jgi:hypothetical protein